LNFQENSNEPRHAPGTAHPTSHAVPAKRHYDVNQRDCFEFIYDSFTNLRCPVPKPQEMRSGGPRIWRLFGVGSSLPTAKPDLQENGKDEDLVNSAKSTH